MRVAASVCEAGPANVSDRRMLRATPASESGTTEAADVMLRSAGPFLCLRRPLDMRASMVLMSFVSGMVTMR